jgi:hypothetical protein
MKNYQIGAIAFTIIIQQFLFFSTVYKIFSIYLCLSIICSDIFMFGSIIHPFLNGNERKLNLRIFLYFILIDILMFLFIYLTRPDHFPSIV